MIQLTKEEIDAIEAEAIKFSRAAIVSNPKPYDPDFSLFEVYRESYVAVVKSERLKIKELAEAAKAIDYYLSTGSVIKTIESWSVFHCNLNDALLNYNKP